MDEPLHTMLNGQALWFFFHVAPRIGKFMETEGIETEGSRGWGVTVQQVQFLFGTTEQFWK